MDWSNSTLWWLATGFLVIVELTTGSFYLLMLALGAAAAALAAHLGLGVPGQLLAAALVGGGATALWHFKRDRDGDVGDRVSDRSVSLDIGQTVHVTDWQPDGTTQVQFRGSTWQAQLDAGAPEPGLYRIVALEGNRLMLRAA